MQRGADLQRELREAQGAVRRLDPDHLVPGGGHQVLLLGLDDAGAEPGDDPVARVEVELAEPLRLGRGLGLCGLDPRLRGRALQPYSGGPTSGGPGSGAWAWKSARFSFSTSSSATGCSQCWLGSGGQCSSGESSGSCGETTGPETTISAPGSAGARARPGHGRVASTRRRPTPGGATAGRSLRARLSKLPSSAVPKLHAVVDRQRDHAAGSPRAEVRRRCPTPARACRRSIPASRRAPPGPRRGRWARRRRRRRCGRQGAAGRRGDSGSGRRCSRSGAARAWARRRGRRASRPSPARAPRPRRRRAAAAGRGGFEPCGWRRAARPTRCGGARSPRA